MGAYNFIEIEKKWQKYWADHSLFEADIDLNKPKFYALDMFPYPSGSGLHVGHPLGYIATDIVARFKRLEGYNVLHPMGFDSFGLPAEQHAIRTGQHPAISTEKNIARYKEQLSSLGFSFDWSREVRTSDPSFYKWTQWIFLKIYELGLAYEDDALINWCPNDKAVLANEEVKNGRCERCNAVVVRRKLRQWVLRITDYADRLLDDLDELDWPESIKLSQRNWIGKSYGTEITFKIKSINESIKVFTTRPDTILGATYMVVAPEHPFVELITTEDNKRTVADYIEQTSKKSDLERTELDKTKTGAFTGSFAINPINGNEIQIWISDYVLLSYGTGAIMAVPGGDQRDFEFAKKYSLPIIQVVRGEEEINAELDEAFTDNGIMVNSGEYNGMKSQDCITEITKRLEKEGLGKGTVNYKLRDWIFTRQRYWGEPIPIIHCDKCGVVPVPEDQLPVELPNVSSYLPTEDGKSPLANATEWVNTICPTCNGPAKRETNTMPQWGGSCWYYLRYLDPKNSTRLVGEEEEKYWMNVDLYIGGAEHAVLHLLYARFWHKVLFDLGYVTTKEPFQKLVNQGMIQGRSNFVFSLRVTFNDIHDNFKDVQLPEIFVSKRIKESAEDESLTVEDREFALSTIDYEIDKLNAQHKGLNLTIDNLDFHQYSSIHVDVNLVHNDILDIEAFKKWRPELAHAIVIPERNGDYICGAEVEKMSKSKYNVVSPDLMIEKFGADTLRLYEMFLGPLEQFKPWNTNGIDGVYKFLKKLWRLFHDAEENVAISDEAPSADEYKILHRAIKKTKDDIESLSLNTSVSSFMICVNELTSLKCNKREILTDLCIIISPFAPHISEELWQILGNKESIAFTAYPDYNEAFMIEESFDYPIMVNGKMRLKLKFDLDTPSSEIEQKVLDNENVQKWLDGKAAKKVIIVHKKIVNVVV